MLPQETEEHIVPTLVLVFGVHLLDQRRQEHTVLAVRGLTHRSLYVAASRVVLQSVLGVGGEEYFRGTENFRVWRHQQVVAVLFGEGLSGTTEQTGVRFHLTGGTETAGWDEVGILPRDIALLDKLIWLVLDGGLLGGEGGAGVGQFPTGGLLRGHQVGLRTQVVSGWGRVVHTSYYYIRLKPIIILTLFIRLPL